MSILMFFLFLLIAAACAGIADALVPGRIPGGFFGTALVGWLGAWVGTSLFGSFGPDLVGVPLVPAILGSAILVFLFGLLSRRWWRSARY